MILKALIFLCMPIFCFSQNLKVGIINMDLIYQNTKEKELLDSFLVLKKALCQIKMEEKLDSIQQKIFEFEAFIQHYHYSQLHYDSLTNILVDMENEITKFKEHQKATLARMKVLGKRKINEYLENKIEEFSKKNNLQFMFNSEIILFIGEEIDFTNQVQKEIENRSISEVVVNFRSILNCFSN